VRRAEQKGITLNNRKRCRAYYLIEKKELTFVLDNNEAVLRREGF
jgi:hypothetical protein